MFVNISQNQLALHSVAGEIRRVMSITIVRANALCLLGRLSQLGPGVGAAARRRQEALRLEERRRRDREAFDMAWHARGSCRVGRAFVPWFPFLNFEFDFKFAFSYFPDILIFLTFLFSWHLVPVIYEDDFEVQVSWFAVQSHLYMYNDF